MMLLTSGIFIIVMIIIILLKIDLIPNSLMSNQGNFVLMCCFFTISTFVQHVWRLEQLFCCGHLVKFGVLEQKFYAQSVDRVSVRLIALFRLD